MLKPFDHLARQFCEVADQINSCDDAEKRKALLFQMRIIVDEADHLTTTCLASAGESLPDLLY